MTQIEKKTAVIGECMLEVCSAAEGESKQTRPAALSFGGDTLNTAIYLSRLDIAVDYVTALGDDDLSTWMLKEWQAEGVGCGLVARYANSVPGLYLVQVDSHGERSFLYWRMGSPASRLLDKPDAAQDLFEKLADYQQIYLSGITLAIYDEPARSRLLNFLEKYVKQGNRVIFDGNYRPNLWSSPDIAKTTFEHMYRIADLVLPTDDDESMLFGVEKPDTITKRLLSYGVSEVVLKMGSQGCEIATSSSGQHVPAIPANVVDTTAAGDSFNAAYIAARMVGANPKDAALAGHRLASTVIQHSGAIIPKNAMPKVLV